MHVKRKDSIEYNAQVLSGGHEFDLGSCLIVKVEKVIHLDWQLAELNNISKREPRKLSPLLPKDCKEVLWKLSG